MRQKAILLAGVGLLLVLVGVGGWKQAKRFSSQAMVDPAGLTGEFLPGERIAYFESQRLWVPDILAVGKEEREFVLGESEDDKRIEIDLTNQRIYGYEGDRQVYKYLVSSGKWGRTPTGVFRIWVKLRYTKMEGGSKVLRTYYYLPNVPYTMYFYNSEIPQYRGYGIHGTYWHNNFGHPMSHGCVNMKTEEVKQLYYWAKPELGDSKSVYASADNPGTIVVIYGEAPWE